MYIDIRHPQLISVIQCWKRRLQSPNQAQSKPECLMNCKRYLKPTKILSQLGHLAPKGGSVIQVCCQI